MTKRKRVLVVFSGGQDSTTCLGQALADSHEVIALSFVYGQKHATEIEAAKDIIAELSVEGFEIMHHIMDLEPVLGKMQSSALVNHGDVTQPHPLLPNLPASFVPVRNALFLTVAFGLAIEFGCDAIYTGVCQTDYSGYPDCRLEFVNALNFALNVGYASSIEIVTPLMHLTKAQTFKLAEDVGALDLVLEHSMTCYNGDQTSNPWGKGCGECPACELRLTGWNEYQATKISEPA